MFSVFHISIKISDFSISETEFSCLRNGYFKLDSFLPICLTGSETVDYTYSTFLNVLLWTDDLSKSIKVDDERFKVILEGD